MDAVVQSGRGGELTSVMGRVFGFHEFRPNQEEIVSALLAGRDVFGVMPTGGGKSLCYQLPACVLSGTCVVISPLISLMKDQVDSANEVGLRAEYINSSLQAFQQSAVLQRLIAGDLDLLYVAPERFCRPDFINTLQAAKLCMFAIDEAHCISEWGHDFRPDYMSLSQIVKKFPNVPLAAFTATATQHVQDDIVTRLGLRQPLIVRASFDRPNLFFRAEQKDDLTHQILSFLSRHENESGIIYRTTRKDVETTADELASYGINAKAYHAGMDSHIRQGVQEEFNRDEINVIVATIAFGMGIDKSNVRFVIHGDLPKSMEGYYQEIGRAGRDGEPAHCVLYYSYGDTATIRYFIDKMENPNEQAIADKKLDQMVAYAGAQRCRRKEILSYFGEQYQQNNCNLCDICAGNMEHINATTEAQMLMSAIARTDERFGAGHIVDIVVGANTRKIRELGHDQIKTYGVGKDKLKSKKAWTRIIDSLISQGCLCLGGTQYPTLQLSEKGRDVLFGRAKFTMLVKSPPADRPKAQHRSKNNFVIENYDPMLLSLCVA